MNHQGTKDTKKSRSAYIGKNVDREEDVTVGSLDNPSEFAPREDVLPEQRLPWVAAVK